MIQKRKINPNFHPKQKLAVKHLFQTNGVNEILYGGAAGAGKSWLGCVFIIVCAVKYPETRYLIGRSKLKHLKQTTLRTMFEVLRQFGLEEDSYWKYNDQKGEVQFFNGSEILLKDLFAYPSDPDFDSLGSLEITAAFIDEVSQVTEKAKNIVLSRIRYKLDEYDLEPKLFMSCNPSKGWLYSKFYKPSVENKMDSHKIFTQALATDNPYISKHYIENLKKLDRVTKARLLDGKWEYADEMAVFDYDSIVNFLNTQRPHPVDEKGELINMQHYFAIDVARLGKDKTVIWVLREDFCIVDFIEMGKSKVNEVIEKVDDLKNKYSIIGNHFIAVDSDGVGGGVADYLPGCKSIVNNSSPINHENYVNFKTQLYAKLASIINSGQMSCNVDLDLDVEQKIQQELMVVNRVDHDKDGKVKFTKKEDVKKALGRSPDYGDSLAYLMAHFLTVTYSEEEIDFEIIDL